MANNCYNFIQINGSVEEIKEFRTILESKDKQENGFDIYQNLRFDFKEFGDFGNDGKWFDVDVHEETSPEEILISGDSAWCPCLELFTAISEKYESFFIRYEYEEMGCDFSGYAEIEKGFCNDHQFTYWKGIFEMRGEEETKQNVLDNELECYETEEELRAADFFALFSLDNQKEILEAFNS